MRSSQFPVLISQTSSSQHSAISTQENPARRIAGRWLKFNLIGGIGILIQLGVLAVFRSWLQLDYLLATGLAVEIAVVHNFFWHERFTWADRPAPRFRQSLIRLAKFNVSNGVVSLVGNLGIVRLLVGEFAFNYMTANGIAIVLCSSVNFWLGDRFVFDTAHGSGGLPKGKR